MNSKITNSDIKRKIEDKTILITGGTGSFGNSMVLELLEFKPKRIIIFSRDEKKQFDMRNRYDNPFLKFVIGDVRDFESVNKVCWGVDYVFHAAALKQVPTCEFFPIEALKTNVIGAYNVIQASIRNNVKRVVILSTDKAVYPINVMGTSKALSEKVMISESRNVADSGSGKTVLCAVRYGNVLYSRGSVVPHFVWQISKNKKLTVTNPDMTRFLMPLKDAADLVLYALVNGQNGYVYVRKSPAATIQRITRALCKIFDYKKGYEEVGIRAGEKMHETLVTQEELLRAKEERDYYKIPPESQGLDYNKYFFRGKKADVKKIEPYTSKNTKQLNISETTKVLLSLSEIQEELKIRKQEKTSERI